MDDFKPKTDRQKERDTILNLIVEGLTATLQAKVPDRVSDIWRAGNAVYVNTSGTGWRIECKAGR